MNGFPVIQKNQDSYSIPRRFFSSGYEVKSQSGVLNTTVGAINASSGLGLAVKQSDSSPDRGRDTIIKAAIVSCSSDCLISIFIGAGATVQVFLKAGEPHYIPVDYDMKSTGGASIWVSKCVDSDSSKAVIVTGSVLSWNIPYDQKEGTKKIRFVGDSITYGYWVDFGQQYHYHFVEELQKRVSKHYSAELIGYSGNTIKDQYVNFKTGKHQYDLDDVAVFVICFGVNDVGGASPISIDDYKAYMSKVVKLLLAQNPNMQVVMMGGTPVTNAANEANGVLYRAKLNEIVLEVDSNRLFAINPTGAYDPLNAAYAGDGIHPSALGHQSIFDNIIIPFLSSQNGINLIQNLCT